MNQKVFNISLLALVIIFFILPFTTQSIGEPKEWEFGEIKMLADGLNYPEGPTQDSEGNLYLVEFKNNNISKITPDGKVSTVAQVGVQNNGLIRDKEGNFFVCDWKGKAIYRVDIQGNISLIADKTSEGDSLRRPNDFAWDNNGNLYFTDPGGLEPTRFLGGIHFIDKNHKIHRFAGELNFPNGLAFDRDFKHLYAGETHLGWIMRIEVKPDGTSGKKEKFFYMGEKVLADGMKVDVEGNLWVAVYSEGEVWCISPQGEKIASIILPGENPNPTNILFGGPDMKTAYITVNDGYYNGKVYTIRMPVAGLPMILE